MPCHWDGRRNRVRTLNWLVTQFRKSIEVSSPYTTSILKASPGHKELTELLNTYKKKGQQVLDHLKQLIADEKRDPVAQKFLALAADAAVMKLKLTDQAVDKAHRRKLLGNPPSSPDKYSVGDEVIWELLLANLKEDLIVVTKDHTFYENLSLLSEEYEHQTGRKLLLVTEKFSKALETMGQAPTKELIEAEKKEAERPASSRPPCNCPDGPSPSGWEPNGRFLMVRCLKCGQVLTAQEDPDID